MCQCDAVCVTVTLFHCNAVCHCYTAGIAVTCDAGRASVTLCVRHLTCLVLVLNGVREEGAVAVERFDPSERDGSARHVDDHLSLIHI